MYHCMTHICLIHALFRHLLVLIYQFVCTDFSAPMFFYFQNKTIFELQFFIRTQKNCFLCCLIYLSVIYFFFLFRYGGIGEYIKIRVKKEQSPKMIVFISFSGILLGLVFQTLWFGFSNLLIDFF